MPAGQPGTISKGMLSLSLKDFILCNIVYHAGLTIGQAFCQYLWSQVTQMDLSASAETMKQSSLSIFPARQGICQAGDHSSSIPGRVVEKFLIAAMTSSFWRRKALCTAKCTWLRNIIEVFICRTGWTAASRRHLTLYIMHIQHWATKLPLVTSLALRCIERRK